MGVDKLAANVPNGCPGWRPPTTTGANICQSNAPKCRAWLNPGNSGQSGHGFGFGGSTFGQVWPKLGKPGSSLVNSWPIGAQVRPILASVAQEWPKFDQTRPSLVIVSPNSPGQLLASFGQFDQCWQTSGHDLATLRQDWPNWIGSIGRREHLQKKCARNPSCSRSQAFPGPTGPGSAIANAISARRAGKANFRPSLCKKIL